MTALEEIKKAIEEICPMKVEFKPDCGEYNSIIVPTVDGYDGTFFTVIGCGDNQDKLGAFMAMAVNDLPELVTILEGWGHENAVLRVRALDVRAGYCEAIARAEAAEAEVRRLRDLLLFSHDTLQEINPSNYDHDDVCKLNDASVEVILAIAPELGETHGKSKEWWDERTALASTGGEHHGN